MKRVTTLEALSRALSDTVYKRIEEYEFLVEQYKSEAMTEDRSKEAWDRKDWKEDPHVSYLLGMIEEAIWTLEYIERIFGERT